MSEIEIYAYSDKLSLRPGDTVQIMASAKGTDHVRAQLVRLIHGDEHPGGPGFLEQAVPSDIERDWPVAHQPVQQGQFLEVADPNAVLAPNGDFTLHAFICPSLPGQGTQAILSRWSDNAGYLLGIDADFCLMFATDGATVKLSEPLERHVWYFVAVSYNRASGVAKLRQHAVINRYNSLISRMLPHDFHARAEAKISSPTFAPNTPFLIAGAGGRNAVEKLYNGKIDRCGVLDHAASDAEFDAMARGEAPSGVIAHWDTTAGYTERGIGDTVIDTGPHGLHALGVNRPIRAMTGWNWNGRNDCFRLAPGEYGGIAFHQDAITDCKWQPTLSLKIPADLRSGVHAVKLTAGEAEEYVVLFIRAATPKAAICFLAPTCSYLAYANGQSSFVSQFDQTVTAFTPVLQNVDLDMYAAGRPYGRSTYDLHDDGAGVCHTSYHRPIFNMRPKYRFAGIGAPWQFAADLSVVFWLEKMGYEWELLTDEDVHREGVAALAPYNVVINGTHCEYTTEKMLDAVEDYLAQGGRLTYLAGNGYYWVVGFRDDEPWIMEVRKLDSGSRAWQAKAGEHYLACTGEKSGLWRNRGRAPQKLVGTGFTSEGMDLSVPYRRLPASYDPATAWIFQGIDGETFGEHGLGRGGAAGLEVDRYDLALGTPPNAVVLAASEPFTDNFPLVQEDVMFMHPGMGGSQHPLVRADMVYFATANNGAVFSPSSIAWGQALAWNDADNSASRVMKNVIDAFSKPGPLP